MKPTLFLLLAAVLATGNPLYADNEGDPHPWFTTSPDRRTMFKMVPARFEEKGDDYVKIRDAEGHAYSMDQDGTLKELWKVHGWFTWQGYLASDGKHFVRMGPWASDQENLSDLAIAFYQQGNLLKEYRVNELIQNREAISFSVSHYQWQPEIQTKPNGFDSEEESFSLVTADKSIYIFDIKTGGILRKERDSGAKSSREVWQEQKQAAETKGKALFAACSFQSDYEKAFEISEVSASEGKISGVWFDNPHWTAHLKPKRSFSLPCLAEPVYPIDNNGRLQSSITPEDIEAAFEKALQHPYVVALQKQEQVEGIRLRPTADRLHWNTPELSEWMESAKGHPPSPEGLKDWAYLIVDCKPHEYRSFYLNTRTGEVLHEQNPEGFQLHSLDVNGAEIPLKIPPSN